MKNAASANSRSTAPATRAPISLNIGRLVLEGAAVTPGETRRLSRAFERELSRLLQNDCSWRGSKGGSVAELGGPAIVMSYPFHAAQAGRQIARSVYRALIGVL
jgi:hypothetical protein